MEKPFARSKDYKNTNKLVAVQIEDLYKEYKNKIAINNINLTVRKGEIFGLLGPNGAGKTTTISILLGLIKADRGSCKIFQTKSNDIGDDIYRKIGVVFEEKNLYVRLTGWQNLRFFANMYGIGAEKITFLLERFNLTEAASRPVKTYSKGMKQRLLLCRALLNDPELLILDEPTDGLDPVSLGIIHNSLLKLKAEGKTILLSTHYMEEAERLCDRLAFINNGEIIEIASPEKLKNEFGKKILEVKISSFTEGFNENLLKELKNIIGNKDKIVVKNDHILLLLSLNSFEFAQRLDQINKKADIISIHSREASLNDVFIKLASN